MQLQHILNKIILYSQKPWFMCRIKQLQLILIVKLPPCVTPNPHPHPAPFQNIIWRQPNHKKNISLAYTASNGLQVGLAKRTLKGIGWKKFVVELLKLGIPWTSGLKSAMYNVILLLHSVASTHNSDVVNRLVRKVKAGRQVSYSEEQITSKYIDFNLYSQVQLHS